MYIYIYTYIYIPRQPKTEPTSTQNHVVGADDHLLVIYCTNPKKAAHILWATLPVFKCYSVTVFF